MYQLWNVKQKAYALEPGSALELKWCWVFYCKAEAERISAKLISETGEHHLVHDMSWVGRESDRLLNGTYRKVAWHNHGFWRKRNDKLLVHFTHISLKNPELIAFTADENKGMLDVQTPMKPGAYLQRFFGDVLDAGDIKRLTELHRAYIDETAEKTAVLQFATEPDDIVNVYRNGPESCMSGDRARFTRVYGAGDLAIAYYGDIETPLARALCWPSRQVYGRVYPDQYRNEEAGKRHNTLVRLLDAAGYRKGSHSTFNGAKLKKINGRRGYVMPYLDWDYGVDDAGDHWVISNNPEFSCQETEGYIEEDERYRCEYCENRCDDTHSVYTSRFHTQEWCRSCLDEYAFYCDHTFAYVHNDYAMEVGCSTIAHWIDVNYCDRDEVNTLEEVTEVVVDLEGNTENWAEHHLLEHTFLCTVTALRYKLELAAESTLQRHIVMPPYSVWDYEPRFIGWRGMFKGIDAGQKDYVSPDPNQDVLFDEVRRYSTREPQQFTYNTSPTLADILAELTGR